MRCAFVLSFLEREENIDTNLKGPAGVRMWLVLLSIDLERPGSRWKQRRKELRLKHTAGANKYYK